MIHTRYLSSEGWVEECSHRSVFDAYMDARRRCVLRGSPYVLFDGESGATLSVLTVKPVSYTHLTLPTKRIV